MGKTITATTGSKLRCKSWRQEGILRMLENNLENAEIPEKLIIYGGTGKAARNWESYHAIVKALQNLGNDETLMVQSGKPIAVFRTWENSPRVIMANSNLVPQWSTWEHFRELEARDLMMYGQMTAGSWCYIGTQGIIQGTYETFAACAQKHFNRDLTGRIVLTGGLGGMGGAQPLAVTMNHGICIAVECDENRINRRVQAGFCDTKTDDIHDAITQAEQAQQEHRAFSIGVLGNTADIMPLLASQGFIPDVVTDQTSAHDALQGYIPKGYYGDTLSDALNLRETKPEHYITLAMNSMKTHCHALLTFQKNGAIVFDYGNNLRGQAYKAGLHNAFDYPGFVPAYIRPLFCIGKGPFRWIALSGNPEDILKTDKKIKR